MNFFESIKRVARALEPKTPTSIKGLTLKTWLGARRLRVVFSALRDDWRPVNVTRHPSAGAYSYYELVGRRRARAKTRHGRYVKRRRGYIQPEAA